MTRNEYRPDIDGLRALAVVAVLFYHLNLWPFTGGFVGVDVFFVISGFLITKIIYESETAGRFSYLDFYQRRVRRLLPALFATIIVTFAVGAWLFLPEDFARLAGSAASALLAASNIYFWNESGYFDVASLLKPLLHTWSLAVEIQFYLFWPAFIVLLVRRGFFVVGMISAAVASLAAAVYVMSISPTMVFYFTPFRMFEFAMGGLVFAAPQIRIRWLLECLLAAGVALVLWSVFYYTDQTPFPGWTALPPCAGAALIIYAGNAKGSFFLRLPPVVWIGRISYSLYLVHWPIIVFLRYGELSEPGLGQNLIVIAMTFALAALSFYAIEEPLRKPGRRKGSWAVAGASAITLVSALSASTSGWTWRYSEAMLAIYSPKPNAEYIWANQHSHSKADAFTSDKRKILVVGDSQAADFTNVMVEAGVENSAELVTRTVFTECGLPYLPPDDARKFMVSVNPYTIKDSSFINRCLEQQERLVDTPALRSADIVIVGYYWRDYAMPYFDEVMKQIRQNTDARVVVLGLKPFTMRVAQMVRQNGGVEGLAGFAYKHIGKVSEELNKELKARLSDQFVDIMAYVCPTPDHCNILDEEGFPTYSSEAHFTPAGVKLLSKTGILSFLSEQAAQKK